MDKLSKQDRSERMSRVRGTDTKPEMVVRRLVHGMGYRYRLHVKQLPGHLDLVFPTPGKINFCYLAEL
jgi:DNA mismatch endonuclease (patch repair protein)